MSESIGSKFRASDEGSSLKATKAAAPTTMEIKVYSMRWAQLALFGSLTFISAMLWVTFAPIATLSADFFGTSTTGINWLSLIFMFLYLPGTLLSSYCTNRFGVHRALVAAAILQAAGAMLRYVAVFLPTSTSAAFSVLMIGQALAALAQPAFVNAPVAIADSWFPVSERDLCTVVGAMANPLGIAVGQLLPTFIVPADVADSQLKSSFGTLLLTEGIIAVAIMCMCLALLKERPPLPPSRAAAERFSRVGAKATFRASILAFWTESREMLFRNNEMAKLFVGFGFGLGVFNAVTTLVEQLVIPAGYNSDDAGIFAGAMVVVGILAAGVAGVVMDKTHKYRLCLRVGSVGVFVSVAIWLGMIFPDNFVGLVIAFALIGVCLLPLLPIALENAVECTYPIPEEGSTSLMMLGGQYLGIIFILSLQALMDNEETFEHVYPPSSILVIVVLACACVLLFWFDGPMLRTEAEESHARLAPEADGQMASTSKIVGISVLQESSSSGNYSDVSYQKAKLHGDISDSDVIAEETSSSTAVALSPRHSNASASRPLPGPPPSTT